MLEPFTALYSLQGTAASFLLDTLVSNGALLGFFRSQLSAVRKSKEENSETFVPFTAVIIGVLSLSQATPSLKLLSFWSSMIEDFSDIIKQYSSTNFFCPREVLVKCCVFPGLCACFVSEAICTQVGFFYGFTRSLSLFPS